MDLVTLKVWLWIALGLLVFCNLFVLYLFRAHSSSLKELALSYMLGAIFGLGLLISGMCRVTKI